MNILALDSALSSCSAAVMKDGILLSEIFEDRLRGQAERLLPMCVEVCHEAGVTFDDLDAIAVTRGPGTFTGVRIGLSAAKGLALALNIPLVGVNTLEAVAKATVLHMGKSYAGRMIVVHDARRSELYVQIFDHKAGDVFPVTTPIAVPFHKVEELCSPQVQTMVGTGADIMTSHLSPEIMKRVNFPDLETRPHARVVAQIAHEKFSGVNKHEAVTPLYLRSPDAIAAKPITYLFQNQ